MLFFVLIISLLGFLLFFGYRSLAAKEDKALSTKVEEEYNFTFKTEGTELSERYKKAAEEQARIEKYLPKIELDKWKKPTYNMKFSWQTNEDVEADKRWAAATELQSTYNGVPLHDNPQPSTGSMENFEPVRTGPYASAQAFLDYGVAHGYKFGEIYMVCKAHKKYIYDEMDLRSGWFSESEIDLGIYFTQRKKGIEWSDRMLSSREVRRFKERHGGDTHSAWSALQDLHLPGGFISGFHENGVDDGPWLH